MKLVGKKKQSKCFLFSECIGCIDEWEKHKTQNELGFKTSWIRKKYTCCNFLSNTFTCIIRKTYSTPEMNIGYKKQLTLLQK